MFWDYLFTYFSGPDRVQGFGFRVQEVIEREGTTNWSFWDSRACADVNMRLSQDFACFGAHAY